MKNVNILTTDIAAINALSGVELTDFLTAGYQVKCSGEREVSLVGFPCLASNKQPVEVGPGIFINRVYSRDSQSLSGKLRYDLSNGLATSAFSFFSQSGWYGGFRVVSFRDNGPAALINIGIVHENVLNAFCADFPRANVSVTRFHCGMTLEQIRMFISDTAYDMPLYNNESDFRRLAT